MIVMLEDTALILDAQIISEQRDLKAANEQKTNKYSSDEIRNMVRQRYKVQQMTTAAILREKKIITSMDTWIITSQVLIGTVACWYCHQASTSMLRRRSGEG